jgi:glycerol uptake facilitator-like aquaporin
MSLARRLAAECVGTAMLLAIVIGSGIMGERLAGGNDAIALLGNTIATGAGLIVLIHIFGQVSGAHFNPAVTLAFLLRRETEARTALLYIAAQLIGAILGVWMAHAMFAEPILQISTKLRDGPAQAFSEAVATFGLIGTMSDTFAGIAPGSVVMFIVGQMAGMAAALGFFGWLLRYPPTPGIVPD